VNDPRLVALIREGEDYLARMDALDRGVVSPHGEMTGLNIEWVQQWAKDALSWAKSSNAALPNPEGSLEYIFGWETPVKAYTQRLLHRLRSYVPEREQHGNEGNSPMPDTSSSSTETYDFFISHASEDKEAIARPLYEALVAHGVKVWFDEATLKLGDSLRRKIDQGLAACRYGIVILSPDFLAKEWPQRELDGLVARETAAGEKAILPIWHRLGKKELLAYSPPLADKLGVQSSEGLSVVVDKLMEVLGP
jgi:hypothetical protein